MKLVLCFALAVAANAADTGADAFARRCSGCHALDVDKEGPRLGGVTHRKAGAVADFPYSDELKQSGIVWDDATLMRWLEDPQKVVPGSDMAFRVPNPEERAAIVKFLSKRP